MYVVEINVSVIKFRLEKPWSLKRMIFLFQGLTKKTGFVIVINNFMQK